MLLILALAALGGCGERPADADADAVRAARPTPAAAGPAASAVAAAKRAVDADPESAPARLQLGSALLANGDAAAAEIELNRARSLGQPADDVLPPLAEALLAQRKFDLLLGAFAQQLPSRPEAKASMLRHLAEAQAMRGDRAAARQLLARALEAQPRHLGARLLEARLSAADGQPQQALERLEVLLTEAADQPDLWLLKAEVLALLRAPEAPRKEALEQALALRPDMAAAHAGLISLALQRGDVAGAQARHGRLAKVLPQHSTTLYFEAVLAEQTGDGARARGLAQELVRRLPNDTAVLMLAGRAAMNAGTYGQAAALLNRATQLAPGDAGPRRLLAEASLRTGWPDKALEALRPFTGAEARDAEALLLASRALRLKGDAAGATALARRALALRPDDVVLRLAVGLWLSGRVREATTVDPLEPSNADPTTGGLPALVRLQIAARDLGGAQRLLDRLGSERADAPVMLELRARLALAQGDRPAARALLERVQPSPSSPPHGAVPYAVVALLARLDLDDKRPDAALARLDAHLLRVPRHLEARLAKAVVLQRTAADPAQVLAVLGEAVRQHPYDPKAHLALIDALDGARRWEAMLVAAQAATSAVPDHVDLMDRLARAQLARHELLQAESSFKRLAALMDGRAYPYVRLAEVQLMRAQVDSARASLRQARLFEPDDVDALRASVAMALRDGRNAEALELAKEARRRWPGLVLAPLLDADIAAASQQWAQAAQAYREALALQPASAEITQRLHDALRAAGQAEAAARLLAAWQGAHPGDTVLLQHLASASLARQDWATAEARYRQLLAQLPDDVLVLNNLAVALARQHKPEAVAVAERALARAPNEPQVMDTLAMAHAEQAQWARAIELQRRAAALSPLDRGLLLNLATLQFRAGDLDAARESFVLLTRIGLGTPLGADAEKLRQQLGLPAGSVLLGNEAWQASSPGRPSVSVPVADTAAQPAPSRRELVEAVLWGAVALLGLGLGALLLHVASRPPFVHVERRIGLAVAPEAVRAWLEDLRRWEPWSGLPAFAAGATRRYEPAAPSPAMRCRWQGPDGRAGGTLELLPAPEPGHVLVESLLAGADGERQLWSFVPAAAPDGGTLLAWSVHEPADFGRRLRHLLLRHERRIAAHLQADLARLKGRAEAGAVNEAPPPAGR
ncbi:MAG: PEP-CTERM system TPR-repeat protein PrsT [Burkholderiaceae bacterium]|nr:PEP-CTERM system TPR-repeat protein PrsT [Burkholderiaceae bacterium]